MRQRRHINLKIEPRHERILERVPGRTTSERIRRVLEAYETQALLAEQVGALKARLDQLEKTEAEARTHYFENSKKLAKMVHAWLKEDRA